MISPQISHFFNNLKTNRDRKKGFAVRIILDAIGGSQSVKSWAGITKVSEPSVYKRFRYELDYLELFGVQLQKGTCKETETIKRLKDTDDIWQLRVNDYRIFYFYLDNETIVMTNWFRKKTNKTPKKEIQKAETIKLKIQQKYALV